jgi:hypothetical protein
MATYLNDLRLTELATGEGSGTWGTTTNLSLELIGEALGFATQQVFGSDADATTTIADGASDPARAMYFKITSAGSLTATRTCTIAPNTISRVMFIENATTGSQSIAISQGSGASVTILAGKTAVVYLDGAGSGAAVVDAMAGVDPGVTDTLAEVLVAGNATGGTDIAVGTGDDITFADSSKAIFGAGSDLQIYHDGSGSFISDQGAGPLTILTSGFNVINPGNTETLIDAVENGAVQLYYDNAAKLATTATGIDVTGTVTADNAEIGTLGASDANAIIDLTGDTTYTDFGFRIIRNSGANGRTDLRHRGTGDFVIEAVEAAEIAFETSDTERFRIASDGSLSTPTLGTSNVRFGVNAGNSITSGGDYNVVVGDEAGTAITTGDKNVAVGYQALATETGGYLNIAIGAGALQNQNGGYYNVAVGHEAGNDITTGIQNTLIGGLAGDAQTTASNNTAVGYQALTATTTGGDNDAFGSEALRSLTTANLNVALGRNAMYSTTTGSSNLAAGTNAMYSNTEGGSNVALGKDALRSNTTASNNTAVGYQAGYSNSTSERITFVGYQAGYSSSPGSNDNTGVGSSALLFTSSGANNTAVGSGALLSNTTAFVYEQQEHTARFFV